MQIATKWLVFFLFAFCLSLPVTRSDEPATAEKTAETAEIVAFNAAVKEYKAAIRQIEQLRTDYQGADADKRRKMNADLTGEVAHAQALARTMVEAAVAAFQASPNTDPRVTDLLMSVAEYDSVGLASEDGSNRIIGGDQFERALPIIKVLIDGGADKTDLYIWGFISAFATSNYDLAANYLEQAKALHAFDNFKGNETTKQRVLELVSSWGPALGPYREFWAKESALREAEAKADDLPRVKLTTSKGEITLELFENEAPQSVANFLTLVKDKFYDGSPFHRVIHAFMAQGGAKDDRGEGGPDYTIRGECSQPNTRKHFRGSLSMAHRPNLPDSGSSQFFLTFVPTGHLDGEHTVFGRVVDGIEVLGDLIRREMTGVPQKDAGLPKPDTILKAEVIRDRGHEYKFDKLSGN